MATPIAACMSCKYYVDGADGEHDGACYRYPPTVHIGITYNRKNADSSKFYPEVNQTNWCGEYLKK